MKHVDHYKVGLTGYTKGRCRCEGCAVAWRTYRREYERDKVRGLVRTLDVGETRDHCLRLVREGWTAHAIGVASGCDHQLVRKILNGEHQGIRPATADKLLAVCVDDRPAGTNTPAREALVLTGALEAAGMLRGDIVALVGVTAPHRIARQRTVRPTTRKRLVVACKLLARQGIVPASVLEEVGA